MALLAIMLFGWPSFFWEMSKTDPEETGYKVIFWVVPLAVLMTLLSWVFVVRFVLNFVLGFFFGPIR